MEPIQDLQLPDADALEAHVIAHARAIDPAVTVIHIDPDLADTAAFCEAYDHTAEEAANCLLVTAKTGDPSFAACLVQASRRLDLNRHSRLVVGARKASFASADDTVARTGMIPGGVTPVGLPDGLPLFIDAGVMTRDRVIIGGGVRAVKLLISTAALADLPGAVVADITRD